MFDWFMVILGWVAVLTFVTVSLYKIVKIATLPVNLRWEVYPVPHEAGDKREYGGSYMEEMDWATKHRPGSRLSTLAPELIEIGKEVFLLKRVREYNRYGVWPFSMAMHWGIYLLLVWVGLLAVSSLFSWPVLTGLVVAVGVVAFVLGAFGALSLAVKRLTNPDLHLYTAPVDLFNLLFLAAIFVTGLLSWLTDPAFGGHRAYIGSVLFLKPVSLPLLVVLAFLFLELFFIYMPFSKLIHYFAKYFTFHNALWDDHFKTKGSATDNQIVKQLGYRVGWSGPHVVPDKTWLEEVQLTALEESSKK